MLVPTVIVKDAITLIAAAVLVVSFLVGPFVQQASRAIPCTFPAVVQNASLPYAHYVPRQGGYAKDFRSNRGTPVPDIATNAGTILAISKYSLHAFYYLYSQYSLKDSLCSGRLASQAHLSSVT